MTDFQKYAYVCVAFTVTVLSLGEIIVTFIVGHILITEGLSWELGGLLLPLFFSYVAAYFFLRPIWRSE